MQDRTTTRASKYGRIVAAVVSLLITGGDARALEPNGALHFPGVIDRLTLLGVALLLGVGWIYLVNRLRKKADQRERREQGG
ncbi:MAG: hypothetical protein AB1428_13305 [Bacteroidota bacterium]